MRAAGRSTMACIACNAPFEYSVGNFTHSRAIVFIAIACRQFKQQPKVVECLLRGQWLRGQWLCGHVRLLLGGLI